MNGNSRSKCDAGGGGLGFGPDWLLGSDEFGGSVTRVKLFNLIYLFVTNTLLLNDIDKNSNR
jgi:hypothetical protein